MRLLLVLLAACEMSTEGLGPVGRYQVRLVPSPSAACVTPGPWSTDDPVADLAGEPSARAFDGLEVTAVGPRGRVRLTWTGDHSSATGTWDQRADAGYCAPVRVFASR